MIVLPFKIADDNYCIDITNIVEVIPVVKIIDLPGTPAYIEGLINYRGEIVPLVNIGDFFSKPKINYFLSTRIIIIDNKSNKLKSKFVAILAEQATETMSLNPNLLKETGFSENSNLLVDKIYQSNDLIIKHINLDKLFEKLKELNLNFGQNN
jgi:chemotaxis signal transduction protein